MCLLKCANVTQKPCVHTLFLRLKQKNKGVYYTFVWMSYHCFRWYATFKNKTCFQNFCQSYILSTDRIKIHQSQPASMRKRRSEGHASGCDRWISIPSVHNTQDWWKFWKRFHGCFVFQSRVSMKTVVTIVSELLFVAWVSGFSFLKGISSDSQWFVEIVFVVLVQL